MAATSHDTILQTLTALGWCFGDVDQVKTLITIHSALHGPSSSAAVESELCNADLRSIGGKSLPDRSLLRSSSHLLGPKVLQVVSARDVSRSSVLESSRNRRVMKMVLTDGVSEIPAVEYSVIDSLSDDVVPGTKIRIEKKAIMRSGIVCLTPDVVTVLGGVVQSLYEEWQMNQKYSGFSRSSLRQEGGAGGPPPFEKFHIGGPKRVYAQNASRDPGSSGAETHGESGTKLPDGKQALDIKANDADDGLNPKALSTSERTEEKPSTSESRPKEVVDYIPIQNQAAAQKLLQKMSQPSQRYQQQRGQRYKGKGREDDRPVFTLDEWERRKTGATTALATEQPSYAARDEDLARHLQNQFDLEDQEQMQWSHERGAAENIKMNMFKFERDDGGAHERGGWRGRDRGRGRGGGGRGRGRSRGR